eukprot:Opistho-2@3589
MARFVDARGRLVSLRKDVDAADRSAAYDTACTPTDEHSHPHQRSNTMGALLSLRQNVSASTTRLSVFSARRSALLWAWKQASASHFSSLTCASGELSLLYAKAVAIASDCDAGSPHLLVLRSIPSRTSNSNAHADAGHGSDTSGETRMNEPVGRNIGSHAPSIHSRLLSMEDLLQVRQKVTLVRHFYKSASETLL